MLPRWRKAWLYQRPDRSGWWVGWYDAGRQHKRTYPTRKSALIARRIIESNLNDWATPKPSGIAWSDAVLAYGRTLADRSPGHHRNVVAALRRFQGVIAPATPTDCSRDALEGYIGTLTGEPATRRNHYRQLSAFFTWCVHAGHLPANPLEHVPAPCVPKRLRPTPTPEQWVGLLETTRNPAAELWEPQGMYLAILLAVVTGLRQSDVLRLRIADIDVSGEIGLIRAQIRKTGGEDLFGLPPAVVPLVVRRLNDLPDGASNLIGWQHFDRAGWRRLAKMSHFPFTFHGLRRAAGTRAALARLRAAGADQLGHSSASVFSSHYEDRRALALAIAERVELPDLPPMPAFAELRARNARRLHRI